MALLLGLSNGQECRNFWYSGNMAGVYPCFIVSIGWIIRMVGYSFFLCCLDRNSVIAMRRNKVASNQERRAEVKHLLDFHPCTLTLMSLKSGHEMSEWNCS